MKIKSSFVCSIPIYCRVEWTYATDPDSEGDHIYYNKALTKDADPRISFVAPYSLFISGSIKSDTGAWACGKEACLKLIYVQSIPVQRLASSTLK